MCNKLCLFLQGSTSIDASGGDDLFCVDSIANGTIPDGACFLLADLSRVDFPELIEDQISRF